MRVLITGSNGFIGSYLAKKLSTRGIDIVGVVRKENIQFEFEVLKCDLSKEELKYDKKIDLVIHAAAEASPNVKDINRYISNNISATQEIIRFMKGKKISRLIYISTISIFGEIRNDTIDENTDIINPGFYGMTKYLSECLIEQEKDIKAISLLLPGVLGKTTQKPWLKRIIDKMLMDETIYYFNGNCRFNNLVHISDIENFIYILLNEKFNGFERILIGNCEYSTVSLVLETLKHKLNSKSKLVEERNNKNTFCINIEKAKKYGFFSRNVKDTLELFCKDCCN